MPVKADRVALASDAFALAFQVIRSVFKWESARKRGWLFWISLVRGGLTETGRIGEREYFQIQKFHWGETLVRRRRESDLNNRKAADYFRHRKGEKQEKGEIADFSLKRLFGGARRPQTGVLGFPVRMIVKETNSDRLTVKTGLHASALRSNLEQNQTMTACSQQSSRLVLSNICGLQ